MEVADTSGHRYLIKWQRADRLPYDLENWYASILVDPFTWVFRKLRHRGKWLVTLREMPVAPVQRRWKSIVADQATAEELADLIGRRLSEGAPFQSIVELLEPA